MKTKIIVIASVILMLCSCGGKSNVEYPQGIENSPLNRARKLRQEGAPACEYMPLQEEAVRELREGRSPHDPVAVLSQSGYFYSRLDDQAKAIAYLQEAADWRRDHPEGETREDVSLLGNLGALYARLDMTDEAIAAFRQAVEVSERHDNYAIDDLMRFLAETYILKETFDSASICFDRAIEVLGTDPAVSNLPMLVAGIRSDKAIMWVENPKLFRDSLPKAVEYLEETIRLGGRGLHTEKFVLGQAYAFTGKPQKGIPMMEAMADTLVATGFNTMVEYAYRKMMETYTALGMTEKSAALYPKADAFRDSINAEKRVHAAIAADIRYKAGLREREARQMREELKTARIRIAVWSVLGVIVICVAVWLTIRYRHAWKHGRREHEKQRQTITSLLEAQKELAGQIKTLNGQLETVANREALSGELARITARMLQYEQEPAFRKMFASVHPGFLPAVRARHPSVTRKEELLLMLIYQHQSTDEIALAFGISRASVNTARYRLRTKFGLLKETDLDEYVCTFGK